MHIRMLFALASAIGVLAGCASSSQPPGQTVSLARLPRIDLGHYKVDPYIQAAAALQAAGKEAAAEKLLALARSSTGSAFENREKIPILCRMLFTPRPGADFERPALGGPQFLGSDTPFAHGTVNLIFRKWPLEPIELVDEVPFAVVTGYFYEGFWSSNCIQSYVRYCMDKCEWSSVRFTTKTKQQKEIALQKLLASPKWQRPVEAWEKKFLRKQIE